MRSLIVESSRMKVGENSSWMAKTRQRDLMQTQAFDQVVDCQIGCTAYENPFTIANKLTDDFD